ncbi:hypothetical protein IFR05_000619 [Cadophora sp. M221]|nr:hypothetical protein IFR05_000619 [Cadophora sp. M221]
MQNLQNQTSRQSELSALELMMESAIMRGLKRHNEELKKTTQHTSVHSSSPKTTPGYHDAPTENTNEQLCSGSYAMIRHDKVVFQTAFRTPFFDIKIETKEAQRIPKPKKGTPLHELSRLKPTHTQRFTKYNVRVKIPFWRGGMAFQSGNAGMIYGGNLCKTFRTYNFVPCNAPIIKACEKFDLAEVRRLFEAGLASPLDFVYDQRKSLVDTVVQVICYNKFDATSISCAIALLKYLISCLNGDVGHVNDLSGIFFIGHSASAQKHWAALAEIFRLGIMHSSDDPLEGIEIFLDIKLSTTPLYQLLVAQDNWWFDESIKFRGPSHLNCWYETDLQMLRDPKALSLQAAISKGVLYRPYHWRYTHAGDKDSCVHMLLAFAADNNEEKFHKCVLSRLVVLLNNGMDPRRVDLMNVYFLQSMASMERPLSCTEYAQIINLTDLWRSALEGAGWSNVAIDGIFDEDLSHATVGLLSGDIQYGFLEDQRSDFIQTLRQGKFVDLKGDTLSNLSRRWKIELGISSNIISIMIRDVASIFKTLKTPGSWPNEQTISLMPGKDFELPNYYGLTGSNRVKNWKCIRDIWENELGGCIPEGYEDSEYSDTSDEDDDAEHEEREMSQDDYTTSKLQ